MSQATCCILATPVNTERLIENQSKRSAKLQGRQKLGMKSIQMSGDHLLSKRLAVGNIIPPIPMIIPDIRHFTFNVSKARLFRPTNNMRLIFFAKKGSILRSFIQIAGENT